MQCIAFGVWQVLKFWLQDFYPLAAACVQQGLPIQGLPIQGLWEHSMSKFYSDRPNTDIIWTTFGPVRIDVGCSNDNDDL